MKHNRIETKLRQAVEHATPDLSGSISEACSHTAVSAFDSIPAPTHKKKRFAPIVAAAAMLALVVCGGMGIRYQAEHRIDSIVGIDVNPSIELSVNRSERVLDATALNADAEIILDNMDLSGVDLDVAMNALIGSMLKNGYITELANSVLISVENADIKRGAALQKKLAGEVDSLLSAASVQGAVLSQTVDTNDVVSELASIYDISRGKAALIKQLTDQNPQFVVSELAQLNINELNLLISQGQVVSGVASTGTASHKQYIGEERAKKLALDRADLSASEVSFIKIKLDIDDGLAVYEIEFASNGVEYDVDVNATTGDIVKFGADRDDD